jgi:hypothetical protein
MKANPEPPHMDVAAVISTTDDVRSGELRNKLFLLEKQLPLSQFL